MNKQERKKDFKRKSRYDQNIRERVREEVMKLIKWKETLKNIIEI